MDGNLVTTIYRDLPNCQHSGSWDQFLEKAGRETVVVHGRTRIRHCDEPNCMSLRAAWGGSESLLFDDGRNLRLDDDCFLILNDNNVYSTRIAADEPVTVFTVYFRDGIMQEVYSAYTRTLEEMLENASFVSGGELVFNEHIREHGGEITLLMRRIISRVTEGEDRGEELYDDLVELLFAMIRSEINMQAAGENLGLARRQARVELFRRLHRARDFLLSNYEKNIGLDELAVHASISSCHLSRFFKKCFGVTPYQYLCKKRVTVAERMIVARPDMPLAEIAQAVGFENRQTLFRNLKKFTGRTPSLLREA